MKISLVLVGFLGLFSCQNSEKNTQEELKFKIVNSDFPVKVKYDIGGKNEREIEIKTLPKRIVILSSSQAGFINELGLQNLVVGVSIKSYFYDSVYSQSHVQEVGDLDQLNFEKIIQLKPDLIFMHPSSLPNYGKLKLLEDAGIPYILTNEYEENNLLNTAEWIKLYGVIFNKIAQSDSIFQLVKSSFLSKSIFDNHPKIMTGFPWKSQWFVAGEQSGFASMVRSAGGELLTVKDSKENQQISLEKAMSYFTQADYWINISDVNSIAEIKSKLKLSEDIKSNILDHCFNNNQRIRHSGANDYWERGVVRPDLILNDLKSILGGKQEGFYFYNKIR